MRCIPSPNCNERPAGTLPDLLVLHCISLPRGEYGNDYVEHLFTNCLDPNAHESFAAIKDEKVSAHAFIHRNGGITQFVSFDQCAWHAGQSLYEGRGCCNDFSIGIELEGTDDTAFEAVQYESLISLVKTLLVIYPSLSRQRIVGHSDIAPQRKLDPGQYFNWEQFRASL